MLTPIKIPERPGRPTAIKLVGKDKNKLKKVGERGKKKKKKSDAKAVTHHLPQTDSYSPSL